MSIQYVNCTQHDIIIVGEKGTVTIPPSGIVPRLEEITVDVGIIDGIKFIRRQYGNCLNLPDKESGVIYIVSALVLDAAPTDRDDLAAPGDLLRDEKGRIIGCSSLRIRGSLPLNKQERRRKEAADKLSAALDKNYVDEQCGYSESWSQEQWDYIQKIRDEADKIAWEIYAAEIAAIDN